MEVEHTHTSVDIQALNLNIIYAILKTRNLKFGISQAPQRESIKRCDTFLVYDLNLSRFVSIVCVMKRHPIVM